MTETAADPDKRCFSNPSVDARPEPGTPGWNAYARLFNAIGEVQGGAQRVAFSTRHYIADHLFKLGYGNGYGSPGGWVPVHVPLVDYLERYVEARGIGMPFYTNGSKIREEGDELIAALQSGDVDRIMEEAADVTITALVAARQHGFTIEEALERKIAKDAGRGPKLNDPNEQGGVRG